MYAYCVLSIWSTSNSKEPFSICLIMFTTHFLQPSNKSITFSAKPYSSQKVGKQNSTSHSPPCNQFFSPNLTYFEEKIFAYFPRKNFELFSSLIPFLSPPFSLGKHNFIQKGKKQPNNNNNKKL